jgi:glutamate-ammonia-ligase adenylyltransferase
MVVSDYLTEIAEVVVARVLEQAWHDLVPRHGRPTDVIGEDTGFAVIGYGKLGGIELGYGSDLDLVFLHGSQDASAMTDGARPLANDVFYARLGQRMIHILTARTPSGVLYEVDMRLRPNGSAGLLVSSLDAFVDYQSTSAWTWEHQALIRARAVAGDPQVRARFEAIRREILCRERDPADLRRDVREMREKMRGQLDKSEPGAFDLKQGDGGIADIEFMVQFSVLRWAHQFPGLVDVPDNIRLLEGLAQHRLLEGDAAQRLADAYRAFRAVYHRQTLQELPGLMTDDQLAEEREWVRAAWSALMES